MKPKCDECKKPLKHYPGDFAAAFDQYEGTVCEKCGAVRCDACWPGTRNLVCPSCGGLLHAAYGHFLRGTVHA